MLTCTPDASRHHEHCSPSVASACSTSRSGSAASNASVFTATGPGTGFGARPPVSRFSRSHRVIVGTDTANVAATSSRGVPIATARTTRSRRSSEYAFMQKLDGMIDPGARRCMLMYSRTLRSGRAPSLASANAR